jgi:2-methylisocitrate lyase-like PEP mutase family enzyme
MNLPAKPLNPENRLIVLIIRRGSRCSFGDTPIIISPFQQQQSSCNIQAMAEARAQLLRSLHQPGKPVVFANVYDVPTAEVVATHLATEAIATASFAIAAVNGCADDELDLDANLTALRRIIPVALKHEKPITVDLQDGYGDQLEHAVKSIISLGASGCNIEDRDNSTGFLFPLDEAVDRIRRAVCVAKDAGVPSFVVNARTDAVIKDNDVDDAIVRGKAYLDAGATTVFVWGGLKRGLTTQEVVRLCHAFKGQLNVIARLGSDGLSVRELAEIGVARISIGPALWRHAMDSFRQKADAYLSHGLEVRR